MKNNQTLWILGHKVTLLPTSGNYDLALFETPAKTQGPPPHTHNEYEEAFVILEGEMEFFINGKLSSEFTDKLEGKQLSKGFMGLQLHDKGMVVEFITIQWRRRND